MTFEEDLLAALRADDGLTAIAGQRSHWGERPRGGGVPAVVLQIAAPGRAYHHGGALALSDPRVQADIYGSTYLEARQAARALTAAMEALPGTTAGGTMFKGSFLQMERDWPIETPGEGAPVHRITQHWNVWSQPAG